MKKPGQKWLPIPGWEDLYEVSDEGLVWRTTPNRGTRGGLLKTPLDNSGYRQLNLCRDGVRKHSHVHILVATAFHGPCPEGMECRHLDGNKVNNRVGNLAWGSARENNLDRVRHGTHYTKYRGATHCIHGHEFTPENTLQMPDGHRQCVACRKRRNKEQAARRKAARWANLATRKRARP